MALKTMSISKLMDLRQKVEATLASKVSEERLALQSRLMNLGRVGSGAKAVREAGYVAKWSRSTAIRKILPRPGLAAD